MDLGLDLREGKSTNEYAVLRARSLAAATALATAVIGFNDLLNPTLPLVFEHGDGFVGASVDAVGTAVAAFVDDVRYVAFQFNGVASQDGRCSSGCRLCLQNRFLDALGGMRQPAQEDAVGH